MAFDLRYNLQHIGDIFVGAVQKTADTALQCSRSTVLSYDISRLKCKRKSVYRDIGERVAQVMKEGGDVTQDAKLVDITAKLALIDKDIEAFESEKANLCNLFKSKNTECACTTPVEGKE
jgi:hypothetical protein